MTQMQTDWLIEQKKQQEFELIRKRNVETFLRMWLSLGRDCITAAGSQHQVEVAEALGIATNRWGRLLDMEQQVIREEQQLAARPKTRPTQVGDETLPDRTIEKRNADWQEETKHRRAAFADMKEQAKRERKELESLRR
jgi:hypothetical protein